MLTRQEITTFVENTQDEILSLYLYVDPGYQENQASTPAWEIHKKNALRDIEEHVIPSSQATWETIKPRLDLFFQDYEPSGKSLVLFMGKDIERSYELPFRIENQARFGKPFVSPLIWAIDEYEHYLTVLVDQEEATILSAYLGHIDTTDEIHIDLNYDWGQKTLMPTTQPGQNLTQGSNRDAFEDMIDEHVQRFHREVAERLTTLVAENKVQRIAFGGSEKAAHAVLNELPEKLQETVIGVFPIPIQTPEHDIAEFVREHATNYEREQELELVTSVINQAKAQGGKGALGYESVLKAFEMQQVELLIACRDADPDLLESLTLKAMQLNSKIEIVHGAAADKLRTDGEFAARLYYSLEPTT